MRPLICLVFLLVYAACNPITSGPETAEVPANPNPASPDTTPRITGIGGIFFSADDPEAMRSWYSENLGMTTDDYGAVFEFRNANKPEEINYLRWTAFDSTGAYFQPSQHDYMINYRVQNLEGLVQRLLSNGATVLDTIAVYEYGKFVHLLDPEGRKIELWEPVDSVLTSMGGPTNK